MYQRFATPMCNVVGNLHNT